MGHLCWSLGKNASFLRVVRCRSLAEEYSVDSVNKDEIGKCGVVLFAILCVGLLLDTSHPFSVTVRVTRIHDSCVFSASCMDNPDSEMVFYLMLRAVDRFHQQHSRYPGVCRVSYQAACEASLHMLQSDVFSVKCIIVLCVFLRFLLSGVYNYQVEEDIGKLKCCVNTLLQEYSLNVNIKDDYIHEL